MVTTILFYHYNNLGMNRIFYFFVLVLFFSGCSSDGREESPQPSCVSCHDFQVDANHQQACETCHNGQSSSDNKTVAHENLISKPAHPLQMQQKCGACHSEIVQNITKSSHYTLKNSTNLLRAAFGAEVKLDSFRDTKLKINPQTPLDLADDLLRRRCFRCHLFYGGDDYPAVTHGTGCAACHIEFDNGKVKSHQIFKPTDKQCLACHYGNYVGSDYYGRFEHDFNNEYRTPYTTTDEFFRPYGVEFHQLQPDIHQKQGMTCIDCHSGRELMYGDQKKLTCDSCHLQEEVIKLTHPGIAENKNGYTFKDRNGIVHGLPIMVHPAHDKYNDTISCQTCHAQWTFNDSGTNLLRNDSDELDGFTYLAVQGSSEVELLVDNNTDYDKEELPIQMSDKFTGNQYPGIWLKGFTMRRWESFDLGIDENTGKLSPTRPILDYHLSWIDEDETVRFDAIPPIQGTSLSRSYVPHTTGNAGMFYKERIDNYLRQQTTPAPSR